MRNIFRKTLKKILKLNIHQNMRAAVQETIFGQLMTYAICKAASIKNFDQRKEAVLNV